MRTSTDTTARRGIAAAILCLASVAALTACHRNKFVLTECVDGRPAVERTLDVAPPNCNE